MGSFSEAFPGGTASISSRFLSRFGTLFGGVSRRNCLDFGTLLSRFLGPVSARFPVELPRFRLILDSFWAPFGGVSRWNCLDVESFLSRFGTLFGGVSRWNYLDFESQNDLCAGPHPHPCGLPLRFPRWPRGKGLGERETEQGSSLPVVWKEGFLA